jgi:hypothetical protein
MRARPGWRYLLLIALEACGGGVATPADAATGVCADSAFAGTCVERFFQPFVACWKGGPPPCTVQQKDVATTVECWPSGARMESQILDLATMKRQITWTQSGVTCMTGTVLPSTGSTATINGATVSFGINKPTSVTCPDGNTLPIDANYGGCQALIDTLSRPACTAGTCP